MSSDPAVDDLLLAIKLAMKDRSCFSRSLSGWTTLTTYLYSAEPSELAESLTETGGPSVSRLRIDPAHGVSFVGVPGSRRVLKGFLGFRVGVYFWVARLT